MVSQLKLYSRTIEFNKDRRGKYFKAKATPWAIFFTSRNTYHIDHNATDRFLKNLNKKKSVHYLDETKKPLNSLWAFS